MANANVIQLPQLPLPAQGGDLLPITRDGVQLDKVSITQLVGPGSGFAAGIAIADAGNFYTVDTIEAALQQLGVNPYNFGFFWAGVPPNAQKFLRYVGAGRTINIPAGFTASRLVSVAAATATTLLPLTLNGVAVGSGRFGAGQTVGTWVVANPVVIAPGDIFGFDNQATADATLADISATIVTSWNRP